MFYCEPCRKKRNWPGITLASYGPCEICRVVSNCYDCPSKYLPLPGIQIGDNNVQVNVFT